jgi:hypothetical protein
MGLALAPISLIPSADPTLMECVFHNFLSNALKFSGKCEQSLLEVGAEESAQGETAYFVRHNGVGFDMACTAHLFEPFIRLHDSDAYPGTGVGLAIVKNVIEWTTGGFRCNPHPTKGQRSALPLARLKASRRLIRRAPRQNRSAGDLVRRRQRQRRKRCRADVTGAGCAHEWDLWTHTLYNAATPLPDRRLLDEQRSLVGPISPWPVRPQLAGWVRSPTAASENSSSLNLGLADWPLSGNRYFRFGS